MTVLSRLPLAMNRSAPEAEGRDDREYERPHAGLSGQLGSAGQDDAGNGHDDADQLQRAGALALAEAHQDGYDDAKGRDRRDDPIVPDASAA